MTDDRNFVASEVVGVLILMPSSMVRTLWLSIRGLKVRAIADQTALSVRTVERHRMRACRALGVRTIAEAAYLLGRAGLRQEYPDDSPPAE